MNSTNSLLESRLETLRHSLDALSTAIDDNLRTLLLCLTCDKLDGNEKALVNIDTLARNARERCLLLVAREHPMARDLKYAMGALRIGHDYERIQELAAALHKRVEHLAGTPMEDIIQDMTGVMADILKLHEVVRCTWHSERQLLAFPNQQPKIDSLSSAIHAGVASVQQKIVARISEGRARAEIFVDLVLACRHLKRIADLMETIPDELHSFDRTE